MSKFTFPTTPAEDGFLIHTPDIPIVDLLNRPHPLDSAKHRLLLGSETVRHKCQPETSRLYSEAVESVTHGESFAIAMPRST